MGFLSLHLLLFVFGHHSLVVVVEDVSFFQIGQLAYAVFFFHFLSALELSGSLQFLGLSLLLDLLHFPFLVSDILHELLDVLHWVKIVIIKALAFRAVHELMLLASEAGDNIFELRSHLLVHIEHLEVPNLPSELSNFVLSQRALGLFSQHLGVLA